MGIAVRERDAPLWPPPSVSSALFPVARLSGRWWAGHRAYRMFLNQVLRVRESPALVTDRPWDHLFLLDACRHDAFEAVVGRPVPHLVSPGSATVEWLEATVVKNPNRGTFSEVVLVSANPYHSEEFFTQWDWPFPYSYAFDLWRDPFWDHDLETVRPEVVTEVAREVAAQGHRLFVHFMQPHFPPVTERLPGVGIFAPEVEVPGKRVDERHAHVWKLIEEGGIPLERAARLYEENLREVLRQARSLAAELEGRVLLTSDHGNLFSDYGLFGHPAGLRVPELVRVPWIELHNQG